MAVVPHRSWPRRHPFVVGLLSVGLAGAGWLAYSLYTAPRPLARGSRREAVLVLGADRGTLGREIALDLERRGFMVIATVGTVGEVERLQRLGRGHIRALALDAANPSTIPICLRQLSSALSKGDGASARETVSLIAIVDALALTESSPLVPLEATPLSALSTALTVRALTPVGILQGVLPLLRQRTSSGIQPVILSLAHAPTARVALPFLAAASAADAASRTLADALRRENPGVRVQQLDCGFFSQHDDSAVVQQRIAELPAHVKAVYGPSLAKAASVPTRDGSPVHQLHDRVFDIVAGRSTRRRQGVGAGAGTYRFAALLPTSVLDGLFALQERVSTVTAPPSTASYISPAEQSRIRPARPLPTPPSALTSEDDRDLTSSVGSLADDQGYSILGDSSIAG